MKAIFCIIHLFVFGFVASARIDSSLMEKAFRSVDAQLKWMEDAETDEADGHLRYLQFQGSNQIERWNNFIQLATDKLIEMTGQEKLEVHQQVLDYSRANAGNFNLVDICTSETAAPPCTPAELNSKFAPIGGRCNNPKFPILGTTDRPMRRILPFCVMDMFNNRNSLLPAGRKLLESNDNVTLTVANRNCGTNPSSVLVENFPITCTGNQLPNPRLVSRTIHTDRNIPNVQVNQLYTMFAQFVDHDLTSTTSKSLSTGNCCSPGNINDKTKCASIIVPAGDPFFATGTCLAFTRSEVFCLSLGCGDDNINKLTAYVDANNVYGSDIVTAKKIRSLSGGKLLTSPGNILPRIPSTGPFTAGETRARENPGLATIHTLFLREHNRVAALVAAKNPSFTDDQIYDLARKLVIAEYQNIVFADFVGLLVGSDNIYDSSEEDGFRQTRYRSKVDPSIFNEFAASAFRFGHSLITALFKRNDPLTGALITQFLHRFTNNNETLYASNTTSTGEEIVSLTKGMSLQPAQTCDSFISQEITNFLYATSADNFLFGSDLAARNIQRGRDNRIAGWANYRKFCTGENINSWDKRPADITAEKWSLLQQLYTNVADIDLFTGSMTEDPLRNAVLGRTSSCIVKKQFKNLLAGDRYFFGHSNGGSQFTSKQKESIRSVSMFDIVCLNTNIKSLQRNAFKNISPNNPLVPCSESVGINVNLF